MYKRGNTTRIQIDSMYNYKKASTQPTPDGHKLWADNLINYIESIE